MAIAVKIANFMEKSSWIRKMFEEGAKLKAEHGAENVFDFSLGNPNVPPPAQFSAVLKETVDALRPTDHGYMPNAGYPPVRMSVAEHISKDQGAVVMADDVIMTCGAAGALNVIFKALLNPGEEVVTPAPFFVEYTFYADNHGGVLKTVPTRPDFTLDLDAMAAAITEKTRIILINSPNNPTGQIYSGESLDALGARFFGKRAKNSARRSTWCPTSPIARSYTTATSSRAFFRPMRKASWQRRIPRSSPSRASASVSSRYVPK